MNYSLFVHLSFIDNNRTYLLLLFFSFFSFISSLPSLISFKVESVLSSPLFYFSIQRIGPESTGLFNNLQPVASIVAAVVIFNEILTGERLVGAFMVLLGIIIVQVLEYKRIRH